MRAPLDEATIVATASRIAHDHGLEALTMRRVAAELGVSATAIYRHVADKDALLTALADDFFATLTAETHPDLDWRTRAELLLDRFLDAIEARPELADLVLNHATGTTASLRLHDRLLELLLDAGFRAETAVGIYRAIFRLVLGHLVTHRFLLAADFSDVDMAAYPTLMQHADHALSYDSRTELTRAVGMILDAAEPSASDTDPSTPRP